MKKGGQITPFIILGLVIIIVLALGIYYRGAIMKELSKIELIGGIAVPEEIKPVKEFIDSCIKDTAEENIIIMGSQGGYIEIEKDDIALSSANMFSNALAIFPSQDFVVPYWQYQTANGFFKNEVPSIKEMQDELNQHINEEFLLCLDDFSAFSDYDITYTEPKTETEIAKEKVHVKVNFPVRIKYEDTEIRLRDFDITVDAALGKLYSIARELIGSQDNFLEEFTIDALVAYDEIPFSGTEMTCRQKIWSKTNVANDLKGILQQNIPFIKIKGLDYSLPNKDYKYFEWKNALRRSRRNVHGSFLYMPSWPFYLDVVPSDGELLKSNQLTERFGSDITRFLASFFCLTDYHFIYDIKYPVLITLSDDKSFSNQGYIFQFAYQVIIDNNQPKINELGIVDIPGAKKDICQFADSEFSVLTLEDSTRLSNADISFKCITTLCNIGKTKKDGTLTANFPRCVNGAIIAEKDGYHMGKAIVSTNEEGSVTLQLKKYHDLDLDVKVIERGARDPTSSEQVIFELDNIEDEYSTTVMQDSKKIRLIPGTYKVNSYVIEESPFEIEIEGKEIESCIKVPAGIFGIFGITKTRCQSVEIPSSTLNQVVKGGAEFEFTIGNELVASRSITLYTIADNTPRTYDELNLIYEKIRGNAQRADFRYPELK